MTIFDRYLLIQFFKIFLICFISFAGLFVVIHIFTNLDEVVEISGDSGGFHRLAKEFYGPRVLDFFNRMSGVLILVAAVFSLALMQRRRETTATEAAGITKARLVRPLLVAALAVIVAAAVCREMYIPNYKSTLVRSLQNWTSDGTIPMHYQKDVNTGILIQGKQLVIDEQRITDIQLTLPRHLSTELLKIRAESGTLMPASDHRPEGLLLENVVDFRKFIRTDNFTLNDQIVIYTPQQNRWLKQTQLFVVCHIDVQELAYGNNLYRYSSVREMVDALKTPRQRFGMGRQVSIHDRILKPVLELTLVLIGLPLVITNPDRNIFLSAAICAAVIMGIEMTTTVAHALGAFSLIRPAALAAWIPVIVLLPLTAFSIPKLFK